MVKIEVDGLNDFIYFKLNLAKIHFWHTLDRLERFG